MIEKEAKTEDDRPMIARVIYNRLALGMKLQIDATVIYDVPATGATRSTLDDRPRSHAARHAVEHLPPRRAAADADRQSRPGIDRGGAATRRRT